MESELNERRHAKHRGQGMCSVKGGRYGFQQTDAGPHHYSFTCIYRAPPSKDPGVAPGARHTKNEIAARLSKRALLGEAVL